MDQNEGYWRAVFFLDAPVKNLLPSFSKFWRLSTFLALTSISKHQLPISLSLFVPSLSPFYCHCHISSDCPASLFVLQRRLWTDWTHLANLTQSLHCKILNLIIYAKWSNVLTGSGNWDVDIYLLLGIDGRLALFCLSHVKMTCLITF